VCTFTKPLNPVRPSTCTTLLESTRMLSQRPQGQRHTVILQVQNDQVSHSPKTPQSRSPWHISHTFEIHTDGFTRPHGQHHTGISQVHNDQDHMHKKTQIRSPLRMGHMLKSARRAANSTRTSQDQTTIPDLCTHTQETTQSRSPVHMYHTWKARRTVA